ncbi:hypothetical protein QL285_080025 [Trifolium repens]|nr:hypothetical protein QL285_080025 [Trifolium repens]
MTFKLKIHYGGQFVNDFVLYYQGGNVHNIANQDPDKWSLFEIHGIVQKDCNVKDKFRIWWYRNSDDRYISIYDDKDANEVYNYACAMNTEVELFVDHSCKGVVASNPTPIPDTIPIPIPDPINIPATRVENVDDATGGGGNSVEGGSEHDGSDTSYYGDDSSEDEAAGIHFDDSEDERAVGLDDGFDVDLEPPPPPPMVDVGCSRNIRTKTVAKRNTPKKVNVIETGVDVVDDVEMEKTYESDELNSSDPDAEDGNKGTRYEKFRMEDLHKDYDFKIGLEFASLTEFKDAIGHWALLNQRQNKLLKNDKVRVRVGCKGNCDFLALVSKVGNKETYRLKKYKGPHTCPRVTNNKTATSKWVAKTVAKRLAITDTVKVREIVYEIKSTYSVGISMNRAWRVKDC